MDDTEEVVRLQVYTAAVAASTWFLELYKMGLFMIVRWDVKEASSGTPRTYQRQL